MEGLLHHAAHGLALARSITDVSGGDRRLRLLEGAGGAAAASV